MVFIAILPNGRYIPSSCRSITSSGCMHFPHGLFIDYLSAHKLYEDYAKSLERRDFLFNPPHHHQMLRVRDSPLIWVSLHASGLEIEIIMSSKILDIFMLNTHISWLQKGDPNYKMVIKVSNLGGKTNNYWHNGKILHKIRKNNNKYEKKCMVSKCCWGNSNILFPS